MNILQNNSLIFCAYFNLAMTTFHVFFFFFFFLLQSMSAKRAVAADDADDDDMRGKRRGVNSEESLINSLSLEQVDALSRSFARQVRVCDEHKRCCYVRALTDEIFLMCKHDPVCCPHHPNVVVLPLRNVPAGVVVVFPPSCQQLRRVSRWCAQFTFKKKKKKLSVLFIFLSLRTFLVRNEVGAQTRFTIAWE
jgi:hypothetical protein